MVADRWQQIEHLYHAALEREARERAALLDQACAGDDQLRREVESLLAAHEQAANFLSVPALEVEAIVMAIWQTRSLAGRQLNHYRILEQLGAGGMGEVYLAEDTRLDRKVALKLLPAQFTQDEDWLRRFVREAKIASALNHPNIIVIHEIGQETGETGKMHYIATEFIEGRTLRQQMKQSGMTPREAIAIATQVAGALAAAHAAGIVHRDIKPENIMVRADGLVKVLDFGLAKLTEAQAPVIDDQATTLTGLSTAMGVVMGTPAYMSPEQARGLKLDARSDIFSLGAVLYEMIACRAAFEGATTSDIIAAILKTEPVPLARFAPETPAELGRIVRKAMRKDREERYQVVKDLMLDLQSFKEELEFETRLASAHLPEAHGRVMIETSEWQARSDTAQAAAARGGEAATAPAIGGAVPLIGAIKRRGALTALAALVVIAAGLAFAWHRWFAPHRQTVPFQAMKLQRLTQSGKARCAAISPDGKYVVYAVDEAGQQSLWLRQVATESDKQIVPPVEAGYLGIVFSRDGDFIYYVRVEQKENRPLGVLYRATILGDSVKRLAINVDSPITLSPDGKRFAFVRRNAKLGEAELMVANEDDASEKRLAVRKHPNTFGFGGPAWSPDGAIIACDSQNYSGCFYQNVVGVRVANGAEQLITTQRWEMVGQIAWVSDGSGLIVTAVEQSGETTQIWYLSFPGAKALRITNDLSNHTNISLTADSGILATVQSVRQVNLWIAPDGDAGHATQITTGPEREDGVRGLAWTPDRKIVYRSLEGGAPNIWMMEADGTGRPRQLSVDAQQNFDPVVSPDGRYVVWSSGNTCIRNIRRIELDGGASTQLTSGGGERFPQYSPDGKWLIYQAEAAVPDEQLLWKMKIEDGAKVQLTDRPSYAPVISPDGKLIACNYRKEAGAPIEAAVIGVEGGQPISTFDLPAPMKNRPIRWMPDGRALAYIVTRSGVSNIWSQPLDSGPPKQLTHFNDQLLFDFAWSRDGRLLALSRGVINRDVVLISTPRE